MRIGKDFEIRKQSEMFGRLVGATIAQNNYFLSKSDDLYFIARHDVLSGLTDQILEYYSLNKGTDAGIADRDKIYMRFVMWMKSDEFAMNIGSKYIFRQPFIVGSCWTPIRRDGAAVDAVVGVRSADEEQLNEVPKEALDIFVRAFCRKFALEVDDEVFVRNNTIYFGIDDFRMTIRLIHNPHPPFAVRLTSAMNQYDDFLDNFSALAFFLHDWFKHIRAAGKGTEQLSSPSSHSITCLLIHFLQFYEQIPQFFYHSYTSNGTYLLYYSYDDIVRYGMPAYHPNMYQSYQDFKNLRRDRPASLGELLIMFFFHYGHLIDLPHVELTVNTTTITKKTNSSCIALTILDEDGIQKSEVPDAFRLQFLMRDAYQLIKDAQNPSMVIDRLMRMRMDESFNAMRDRVMKADPLESVVLERAIQNVTEYAEDVKNHKKVANTDNLLVTKCGDTTFYRRTSKPQTSRGRANKDTVIPPFCDEHHAMKAYLQRPKDYKTGGKPALMDEMMARACKMFMTTYLPNPNNLSQLNVIFRPPVSLTSRMRVCEEPLLEPYLPENKPFETRKSFVQMVKSACHREMKDVADIRRRWNFPVIPKLRTPLNPSTQMTPSKPTTSTEPTESSPVAQNNSAPAGTGYTPALLKAMSMPAPQTTWEELNRLVSFATGNSSPYLLPLRNGGQAIPQNPILPAPIATTPENKSTEPQSDETCSNSEKSPNTSATIDIPKLMDGLAPGDLAGLRCRMGAYVYEQFKENVKEVRSSWMHKLEATIQPNVEYTGLNHFD